LTSWILLDNVQNDNNCINVPSSQTFRSYLSITSTYEVHMSQKECKEKNITIRTIIQIAEQKRVDDRTEIPIENLHIHKYMPTKWNLS
jgi:hypothetical protein